MAIAYGKRKMKRGGEREVVGVALIEIFPLFLFNEKGLDNWIGNC